MRFFRGASRITSCCLRYDPASSSVRADTGGGQDGEGRKEEPGGSVRSITQHKIVRAIQIELLLSTAFSSTHRDKGKRESGICKSYFSPSECIAFGSRIASACRCLRCANRESDSGSCALSHNKRNACDFFWESALPDMPNREIGISRTAPAICGLGKPLFPSNRGDGTECDLLKGMLPSAALDWAALSRYCHKRRQEARPECSKPTQREQKIVTDQSRWET